MLLFASRLNTDFVNLTVLNCGLPIDNGTISTLSVAYFCKLRTLSDGLLRIRHVIYGILYSYLFLRWKENGYT